MDSVENIRRDHHFTSTHIELTIHMKGITQSERRHGEACVSSRYHVGKKGMFCHRCLSLKHRMNIIQQLFFENYVFTQCIENRKKNVKSSPMRSK